MPLKVSRGWRPQKAAIGKAAVSETFTAAKEMAMQVARDIRLQLGDRLTREECQKLVTTFQAGVVPRRKGGRRPKMHPAASPQ
jgi:hypothetical protein